MGLTSAMLTGFTGIKSNQYMMDTIGDNVANVNTTAFKNQRTLFESLFYNTIRDAAAPSETTGGINPQQVGLGSGVASIQRNFGQGTIQDTGVKSDLALDGAGFFLLDAPNGDRVYTRDGSFRLDEQNNLVTSNGSLVQGYAADESGNLVTGELTSLNVPLGIEREAVATQEVVFDGNLDADATLAGSSAVATSAPLLTTGGAPATSGTALTALLDDTGNALFATGDVLSVRNVQKGGSDLPETQFTVGTDGSTLGDLASFLERSFAINADAVPGGTAGVTVNADGSLMVTSNPGIENAIVLEAGDLRNSTSGVLPFSFANAAATGEGASTDVPIYDSLGNRVVLRVRTAMESQDNTGTVWRFYVEHPNAPQGQNVVGTGTVTFDQDGQFVSSTGTTLSISRAGTGAVDPLQVTLDMTQLTGLTRGTADPQLVMSQQDGYPAGTLIDYAIDEDGIITGTFDNSQTHVYGQVAVATFANPEGLEALSENVYVPTANSGEAQVATANALGAGTIRSGALELSNVELSREFIGLVTASTGFSAASRVVRTADEMLQELLLLAR